MSDEMLNKIGGGGSVCVCGGGGSVCVGTGMANV